MKRTNLIWVGILLASMFGGYGDVLRLSLVVGEEGNGIEEMEMTYDDGGKTLFVKKEAIIGDSDVETASLVPGAFDQITVWLTIKGGEKLKKATEAMRKGVDRMAIIIEGKLIMAPVVQGVLNRQFVVSGLQDLDLGELDNLARRMEGKPLRPAGEELVRPKREMVETIPYTEEEYQKIKAGREKIGLYFLDAIPGEDELNKLLRKGMSYDEVVKIFGPCSGIKKEPAEKIFRLDYTIAPEKAPVNPKRESFPAGISMTFEEGRVAWWGHNYSDGTREEKVVRPEQPKPGPRALLAGMPEYDISSGYSSGKKPLPIEDAKPNAKEKSE